MILKMLLFACYNPEINRKTREVKIISRKNVFSSRDQSRKNQNRKK